jgi:Domain of unknown function (DUF4351)
VIVVRLLLLCRHPALMSDPTGAISWQMKYRTEDIRILLRLLEHLLRLSPEVSKRVTALSSEQLLELSDALLEFNAASDLINWLDQHQGQTELQDR